MLSLVLCSYAFLDIGPASEGHSLIIPKCNIHILLIERTLLMYLVLQIIATEWIKFRMSTWLKSVLWPKRSLLRQIAWIIISFRYSIARFNVLEWKQAHRLPGMKNNGKIAYQHVFHVHFHVIPRRNKDEGITELKWPRVERPLSELTGVLKKMQERLETNAKANMWDILATLLAWNCNNHGCDMPRMYDMTHK